MSIPTSTVNADEQVKFALGSLNLGGIHVEEADRVALEALSLRLVPLQYVRHTEHPAPCRAGSGAAPSISDAGSTAATRRGNRRAAVMCNAGMRRSLPPRLRSRWWSEGLRPGLQILDRRPLAPLGNRLGVNPELSAQRRERSLRSLYCCSDGVRGRGAPVTYLSHAASFPFQRKNPIIKPWDQTPKCCAVAFPSPLRRPARPSARLRPCLRSRYGQSADVGRLIRCGSRHRRRQRPHRPFAPSRCMRP